MVEGHVRHVVDVFMQVTHGVLHPVHTSADKSLYKPTLAQSSTHVGLEELYR